MIKNFFLIPAIVITTGFVFLLKSGFSQGLQEQLQSKYDEHIELAITQEAVDVLDAIRKIEIANYLKTGEWISLPSFNAEFPESGGFQEACGSKYLFSYKIDLSEKDYVKATATRCMQGGMEPQGKFPYEISLIMRPDGSLFTCSWSCSESKCDKYLHEAYKLP
jgi:hypothetical protein